MNDDIPDNITQVVYEEHSRKTFYSSFNRSASALEDLSETTKALTSEVKKANESSARLTASLNWLTLAAVIIAGLALTLEVVKLCLGN